MLPLGSAIICAVRAGIAWPLWTLSVPRSVSDPLLWISGIFTAITVLNLAIRAWGAPFAIALSRRLATDWLYARVRNPMVLACVLSLGGALVTLHKPAAVGRSRCHARMDRISKDLRRARIGVAHRAAISRIQSTYADVDTALAIPLIY
jgi:hypothetical protein